MKTQTIKMFPAPDNITSSVILASCNSLFNFSDTQIKIEYALLWINILTETLSKKLPSFICKYDSDKNEIVLRHKHNKKISIKGLNALQIIIDDHIIKFV